MSNLGDEFLSVAELKLAAGLEGFALKTVPCAAPLRRGRFPLAASITSPPHTAGEFNRAVQLTPRLRRPWLITADRVPIVHVVVRPDGRMTFTSNGAGFDPDAVSGLADYSVWVSSREACVAPSRGQHTRAAESLPPQKGARLCRASPSFEAILWTTGKRRQIHLVVDSNRHDLKVARTAKM
jgi:hypothetical protein